MTLPDLNQRLNYLQSVAQRASRVMKLGGTPKMKVKNTRRGRAYPHKGYFTVPMWAVNTHQSYAVAYVIHELSHFTRNYWMKRGWTIVHHGRTQRRVEAEVAERFGLRLIYPSKGCYPRQVRCLETGRVLAERYGVVPVNLPDYEHPACLI